MEKIDNLNYKVTVGGGILMKTLAKRLCLLSLSGLEDIIDIPGTVRGGVIMNAAFKNKRIVGYVNTVRHLHAAAVGEIFVFLNGINLWQAVFIGHTNSKGDDIPLF